MTTSPASASAAVASRTAAERRARPSRGGHARSLRPAPVRGRAGSLPGRLAAAGRPVRAALLRVPFVVALIVLLACAVGGVLYLNTKTDESGMRTQQATSSAAVLRLRIEALNRSIAALAATPRIAEEARALGMVPAGDAAILTIGADGRTSLIGTPTPVPPAAAHRSGR